MHRPAACLFDLDGVLLDTENLHSQAWSKAAEIYGKKLSRKQLILLKGRRRFDCAQLIVNWIEKPIKVEDFLKTHKPISNELMKKGKAMPGAESLVRWCFTHKLPMALVTSSTTSSVTLKSSSHSWLKLIKCRVHGDDPSLREGKPSPEPFLLAANKLLVNPKNCWALEDSDSGTKAALGAGCKVWVLNAMSKKIIKKNTEQLPRKLFHIQHLNEILEELVKLEREVQ